MIDNKYHIIWKYFYPGLPLDYQTEWQDACGHDVWNCEKSIEDALEVVDKIKDIYNFHCGRNGKDSWYCYFTNNVDTCIVAGRGGKTLCEAITNTLLEIIYEQKKAKLYGC